MTEPHLTRQLEQALLSALYLDPAASAKACDAVQLEGADFADPRHEFLYRLIRWLMRQRRAIDPLTILHAARDTHALDKIGGEHYFTTEILDAAPTAAHAGTHAMLVKRAARLRRGEAPEQVNADEVQGVQVEDAIEALDLHACDFLGMPWKPLDAVVEGMHPAYIAFLCAVSGGGKTSALLTAMCRWHAEGHRVYYAGLETRPNVLRTQWACRALGYDPGDILTGAYLAEPHADLMREKLRAELRRQKDEVEYRRVRFSPHPRVSVREMTAILAEAHQWGASIVVIDHIDHIRAEQSTSHYAESRAVHDVLHELVNRWKLRVLVASQINHGGLSTDPWRNHRPVREDWVFMGGHKKQLADLMLGIYRPIDVDATKEQRKAVEEGRAPIGSCLEPHVTAVNVMKHRLRGARTGQIVRLGFHRGELLDYVHEAKRPHLESA